MDTARLDAPAYLPLHVDPNMPVFSAPRPSAFVTCTRHHAHLCLV